MNWYGPPIWKHVLCVGWGEIGAIHYFDAHDMRPGIFQVEQIARLKDDLSQPDALVIGHNVAKHDLPMVNGLCLIYGLGPLPELRYRDTMNNLKTGLVYRNTLRAQCKRYGITLKTGSPDWDSILQGDPSAWHAMEAYNRNDVLCTLELEAALAGVGLECPTRTWTPRRG